MPFKPCRGDVLFLGVGFQLLNDCLVLAGDGGVVAVLKDIFAAFEILLVDRGFERKGNLGGFEVCAFDPTEADILGGEVFEVGFSSVEISLEDGASESGEVGVDALDHFNCSLSVGRTFHVGADEDVVRFCFSEEGSVVAFGHLVALVEAEGGELD